VCLPDAFSFFALQRKKEKNKPLEIFFTATAPKETTNHPLSICFRHCLKEE
jgi:hypothetical protein